LTWENVPISGSAAGAEGLWVGARWASAAASGGLAPLGRRRAACGWAGGARPGRVGVQIRLVFDEADLGV
jgi:hypothetical protein